MASCKDCLHFDVCTIVRKNGEDRVLANSPCKHFLSNTDVAKEILKEIEPVFMSFCLSLEAYKAWQNLKEKYIKGA